MAGRTKQFLLLVAALFVGRISLAQDALTIALDDRNNLIVDTNSVDRIRALGSKTGLVLWGEAGDDQWNSLTKWRAGRRSTQQSAGKLLLAGTRGDVTGHQQAMAVTTQPLDQLLGAELLRAATSGGIITPLDRSAVANPQITIRRFPREQAPEYPADEYLLYRGKTEVARIPIAEGAESLPWAKIGKLPENVKSGLPPGRYLLESKANGVRAQFTVYPPDLWKKIGARANAVGKLGGVAADDPLASQLLVEELLGHTDGERPVPLVADAFDVLTNAHRTRYLENLYQRLKLQLTGKSTPKEPPGDVTGIQPIDMACDYIAHGQWRRALDSLSKISPEAPARDRGLAQLYSAVVLAESGATTGGDAEYGFKSALETLNSGGPADLFRAHYNYSNFLLRRAQDRLYNHAFQAATGGRQPLFGALSDWVLADQQLKATKSLAAQAGPGSIAAVKVNVVRQYTLLADLLAVLNSGLPADDRFVEGEQTSIEKALLAANELVHSPNPTNEGQSFAAVAHEILAQLAYRQADYERCLREASAARALYLDQGMLMGVEGIERLVGLVYMRQSVSAAERSRELRDLALKHFLLSQQLAEVLRDRFPADVVGQTRAGFFARRAYVNEKIVELYLANGQTQEALQAVEAVKSRALSDVLMLQQNPTRAAAPGTDRIELGQIKWPTDTVALEYFIGTERAWLFVVLGTNVQAFPLVDSQAKPIESRRLIADVQQFLFEIEGSAEKMLQRIQAGRALDAAWQDQLHNFYNVLIPTGAREEIARAKTVLIVPHHILHYFPFAALVTAKDSKPRNSFEMPMPQFLIDQGQTIAYAPSLSTWAVLRGTQHVAHRVNAVAISEFASAKPLPGVKQDLKNLQATFGSMVALVVKDNDATEEKLRTVLQQPGFTFIGTHGANVADQPLASYLLCKPGKDDGEFMAGELYESACACDVVVLSACYSGLGDRSPLPGDDLFGIQRALLHTGVGTVVAGLWDVYDDTGVEIMRNFFNEVHTGETVPRALAGAQRKFLAARRTEGPQDFWIHPYFWAVYKSTGSDLARVDPSADSSSKK